MSAATDLRAALVSALSDALPAQVYDSRTRGIGAGESVNVTTSSGRLAVGPGFGETPMRSLVAVVEIYATGATDAAAAARVDAVEAVVESIVAGTPDFRRQWPLQSIDRLLEYSVDSKGSAMRLTLRCTFEWPDKVPDVGSATTSLRAIWGDYDIDSDGEPEASSDTEF